MKRDKLITKDQELTADEEKIIQQKLTLELVDKHYRITRNAAIASISASIPVVWALYQSVHMRALGWFIAMCIVHGSNILLSLYYQYRKPSVKQITPWIYALRTAIFFSAFTWGSMGFLLITPDPQNQAFILFFLTLVSSSLALGTTTDYVSSIIGISCMLVPFIAWHFYQALYGTSGWHIQNATTIIIYMGFLLSVSFVGYRLVKKSTILSFINIALREKLSTANNILELRVKERTKELQKANENLEYQASHDELTGLINHDDLLTSEINSMIHLAKIDKCSFALVYMTLNNLPEITSTYGIKPDNDAVKEVANRLQTQLPDRYRIFMNRRDTFVIIIYQTTKEEMTKELANIEHILDSPFILHLNNKSESIPLKASIGVAMYPVNGDNAETLKMNADLTMFYAKQISPERTQYALCSNNTADRIRLESRLKRDMTQSIEHGEFFLVYQIVIDLKTGKPCGAEALARWQHPTLGLIPPTDFIELAERSGEIIFLGEWLFQQACLDIMKMHANGHNGFPIAINLSARQLENVALVENMKTILQKTGLNPHHIEIELTETAKFGAGAIYVLKEIDHLGINISVDDFGQGQSGLSLLKEFDFVKKIKIDRAFIKDLPHDVRSKEIVIHSVNLAKSLSQENRQIKVLVEGVDKPEQLPFLKQSGVDMVQGYYFSKPIIGEDFIQFLHANPKFEIKT